MRTDHSREKPELAVMFLMAFLALPVTVLAEGLLDWQQTSIQVGPGVKHYWARKPMTVAGPLLTITDAFEFPAPRDVGLDRPVYARASTVAYNCMSPNLSYETWAYYFYHGSDWRTNDKVGHTVQKRPKEGPYGSQWNGSAGRNDAWAKFVTKMCAEKRADR